MRKRIMRPARAVVIAAASIAAVACSDYEPMEYGEVYLSEYGKDFESIFGKVAEDQTWDFSSYALNKQGLVWKGYGDTRAALEGEHSDKVLTGTLGTLNDIGEVVSESINPSKYPWPTWKDYSIEGGWVYIPTQTTFWLDENLPEAKPNGDKGASFSLEIGEDGEDLFILPIYQGGANSAWDLYLNQPEDEGEKHKGYKLWTKSENIQVKIYREILPDAEWGESKKHNNQSDVRFFEYHRFDPAVTRIENGVRVYSTDYTTDENNKRTYNHLPKKDDPNDEYYKITAKSVGTNVYPYKISGEASGTAVFDIVNVDGEEDVKLGKDWVSPQFLPCHGDVFGYLITDPALTTAEIGVEWGNREKKKTDKIADIEYDYGDNSGNAKAYYIPNWGNTTGFRKIYQRWGADDKRILIQDNGFYANTMAWENDAFQEKWKGQQKEVRSKVIKIDASKTAFNTPNKKKIRLGLRLIKKGVSEVGMEQWSDEQQMISLDNVEQIITPELKRVMSACAGADINDIHYMVVGCEVGDMHIEGTDGDFNDVVFLVFSKNITKTETIKKRYFIEDMGSAYDFDFNDIVVDVEETCKKKNGIIQFDKEFTQKATIRHLCGTRPFQVIIGDDPNNTGLTFAKMPGQGATNENGVGVTFQDNSLNQPAGGHQYEMIYTNKKENGEIDANLIKQRLWDPDNNNIKVRVYNSMEEDTQYSGGKSDVKANAVITFPKTGDKAPFIIATDPKVEWTKEHRRIPRDWLQYSTDGNKVSWMNIGTAFSGGVGVGVDASHQITPYNPDSPEKYAEYKNFEQMGGDETLNGSIKLMLGHLNSYKGLGDNKLDIYMWIPRGLVFKNAKIRVIRNGKNYDSNSFGINNIDGPGKYYQIYDIQGTRTNSSGNAESYSIGDFLKSDNDNDHTQLYFVIDNSSVNVNNSNFIFNNGWVTGENDKMRIYTNKPNTTGEERPKIIPLFNGKTDLPAVENNTWTDANNWKLENLPNLQTGGTLRITCTTTGDGVKIMMINSKGVWVQSESWGNQFGMDNELRPLTAKAVYVDGVSYIEVPLTEQDIDLINGNHTLVIQGVNSTITSVDYYTGCQRSVGKGVINLWVETATEKADWSDKWGSLEINCNGITLKAGDKIRVHNEGTSNNGQLRFVKGLWGVCLEGWASQFDDRQDDWKNHQCSPNSYYEYSLRDGDMTYINGNRKFAITGGYLKITKVELIKQ